MIRPLGSNVVIQVITSAESETASGIILKSVSTTTVLKLIALGDECKLIGKDLIGSEVHIKAGMFSGIGSAEDEEKYLIGSENGILGIVE